MPAKFSMLMCISRHRKHVSGIAVRLIASLLLLAIFSTNLFATNVYAEEDETQTNTETSDGVSEETTTYFDPAPVGAPSIDGTAYVLYDVEAGQFLFGNNADAALPPASITKVLTILLAFENLSMDDKIVVTKDMYESIPTGYQVIGLVEGEEITVEDAIYACFMISANDACMALAITMGGTVENFSKMMNEEAEKLGCTQTNFTNPYGLSDPDHLTSAHDMALILSEALKYDSYSEMSMTPSYTIPATNKSAERPLSNGNRFISTTEYAYDYYIGGKTGFTDLSQFTIVAAARKNGHTLIGVIFGASCSTIRYTNLISLFDYGFSTYTLITNNPDDMTNMIDATDAQVKAVIESAGYNLEITNTTLDLIASSITYSTKATNGYSYSINTSEAAILADSPKQELILPIVRTYTDGTTEQIGTYTVEICDTKTAIEVKESQKNAGKKSASIWTIIFRVVIALLLVVILGFAITIYVMVQKRKRKRRNYRNPRVL